MKNGLHDITDCFWFVLYARLSLLPGVVVQICDQLPTLPRSLLCSSTIYDFTTPVTLVINVMWVLQAYLSSSRYTGTVLSPSWCDELCFTMLSTYIIHFVVWLQVCGTSYIYCNVFKLCFTLRGSASAQAPETPISFLSRPILEPGSMLCTVELVTDMSIN